MDLAKILLPIHDRLPVEDLAAAAFAIAARFRADVEALYASEAPIAEFMAYGEAGVGMQSVALIEETKKRAAEAKRRAQRRYNKLAKEHANVASRLLTLEGSVTASVAARARLADLTVIPTIHDDEFAHPAEVREAAVFHSGKPVLVIPPGAPGKIGETVVIGWKDSIEAARAVSAARPFIAAAKSVRIVSAGKDAASQQSLADMRDYVGHYNKMVETAVIGKDRPETARLLLEETAARQGGLLVMGAYSHWRFREWIMGGVTDYVLRHAAVPMLMAH